MPQSCVHGSFLLSFSLSQQRLVHSTSQRRFRSLHNRESVSSIVPTTRLLLPNMSFQYDLMLIFAFLKFWNFFLNRPRKEPAVILHTHSCCFRPRIVCFFFCPQGRGNLLGKLCSANISCGQWPWAISLLSSGNSHLLFATQHCRCLLLLLKMTLHFCWSLLILLHYFC